MLQTWMEYMPNQISVYLPYFAITISLFALVVGVANLYWNIFRELSLRARMRVSFGHRQIFHDSLHKALDITYIGGTNIGPGSLNISNVVWKNSNLWRKLFRKVQFGIIVPDYRQALTDKIPKKIDQGDGINLFFVFPFELKYNITHVGLSDTYGRNHWASRSDTKIFRKTCADHVKKFAEQTEN